MPKAKFTWRRTASYYTLIRWSDVLMNAELPFEYTNGPGEKFWYVPPIVSGKVAYNEHIRLGAHDKHSSGYVRLMIGSVILIDNYDMLVKYLQDAGKRLSDIKKEIEEGEEFTVQV